MNIIQVTISLLVTVTILLIDYYYYKNWLHVNCVIEEESLSDIGEDVFYDIDEEIISVDNELEGEYDELFEDCLEEQPRVKTFLELFVEGISLVERNKETPVEKAPAEEPASHSRRYNTKVRAMERREAVARLLKKDKRRRGLLPPSKKVTFANKVQTLVFCKEDSVVSEPILGKRSADVSGSVDFVPKKANTADSSLHNIKSALGKMASVVFTVLGKRSADILDSVGFVPKKAKTANFFLHNTKSVLGKRSSVVLDNEGPKIRKHRKKKEDGEEDEEEEGGWDGNYYYTRYFFGRGQIRGPADPYTTSTNQHILLESLISLYLILVSLFLNISITWQHTIGHLKNSIC